MANLNQIARTTRLGMAEGPAMPANLTSEQLARSTSGMKTALGLGGQSSAGSAQLSAVAGARRSLATEPRTTLYNTLGQRISALESVKKTVADHYARYDASKRNLARSQEEALAAKTEMEETRKTEQQRQHETSLAELARQQSTLRQEGETQQARRSQTAAEQQRQTASALEARLAENKKQAEAQAARQKAEQEALQARATAEQEAQAAATKKQQDEYIAAQKAELKRTQEAEKKPKREYFETLIKTRQNNYMKAMGALEPNALVVYDPGLAWATRGEDGYTVEIPEFPEELAPADDPDYKPPGVLPNLEDYLVDYDQSFSGVHPAYTRVFWQLPPEQRQGYLAAGVSSVPNASQTGGAYDGQALRQYLENVFPFELDPDKPLIKKPMPGYKPLPGRPPTPPDPRTQPGPPGSDQPAVLATPVPAPAGAEPQPPIAREPGEPGLPPSGSGHPALGQTPASGREQPIAVREPGEPGLPPMSYEDAAQRYLQDNPDVARAGMDPWQHYNQFGQNEGRVWRGYFPPNMSGKGGGGNELQPTLPPGGGNWY